MNLSEMHAAVAERAGLSRKDAARAVNAFLGALAAELRDGKEVRLSGFGTFSVRRTPARKGRNPGTGAEIDIPARSRAAFRAAKQLNEAIRAGEMPARAGAAAS